MGLRWKKLEIPLVTHWTILMRMVSSRIASNLSGGFYRRGIRPNFQCWSPKMSNLFLSKFLLGWEKETGVQPQKNLTINQSIKLGSTPHPKLGAYQVLAFLGWAFWFWKLEWTCPSPTCSNQGKARFGILGIEFLNLRKLGQNHGGKGGTGVEGKDYYQFWWISS